MLLIFQQTPRHRLLRGSTIILIKYASNNFRLKVFLGAIDNTDH